MLQASRNWEATKSLTHRKVWSASQLTLQWTKSPRLTKHPAKQNQRSSQHQLLKLLRSHQPNLKLSKFLKQSKRQRKKLPNSFSIMPVENYLTLLPIIMLGIFFFSVTVGTLYWSAKRGQLRNFDEQAKVIFTDEEPEGEVSDRFPS